MTVNIEQACKDAGNPTQCIDILHSKLLSFYDTLVWSGFNDPDGMFTFSDVLRIATATLKLIGNYFIYLVAHSATLHDFFEIGENSFNGTTAMILSVAVWLISLWSLVGYLDSR